MLKVQFNEARVSLLYAVENVEGASSGSYITDHLSLGHTSDVWRYTIGSSNDGFSIYCEGDGKVHTSAGNLVQGNGWCFLHTTNSVTISDIYIRVIPSQIGRGYSGGYMSIWIGLNGAITTSPFTTLSFMALLVIPHFKISDQGLFDGDEFCFVDLIKQYLY